MGTMLVLSPCSVTLFYFIISYLLLHDRPDYPPFPHPSPFSSFPHSSSVIIGAAADAMRIVATGLLGDIDNTTN